MWLHADGERCRIRSQSICPRQRPPRDGWRRCCQPPPFNCYRHFCRLATPAFMPFPSPFTFTLNLHAHTQCFIHDIFFIITPNEIPLKEPFWYYICLSVKNKLWRRYNLLQWTSKFPRIDIDYNIALSIRTQRRSPGWWMADLSGWSRHRAGMLFSKQIFKNISDFTMLLR